MTLMQTRIELASYWASVRGVWIEGTLTETRQARLTRMADEVFTGSVTMEVKKASIQGLGTPGDLDARLSNLDPMPGWVTVPNAPDYQPMNAVVAGVPA